MKKLLITIFLLPSFAMGQEPSVNLVRAVEICQANEKTQVVSGLAVGCAIGVFTGAGTVACIAGAVASTAISLGVDSTDTCVSQEMRNLTKEGE